MEIVIVVSSENSIAIWRDTALKFVKNAFIFNDLTQLWFHTLLDQEGVYWFFIVADVPDFHCQVVSRNNVFAVVHEIYWWNARNQLVDVASFWGRRWLWFETDCWFLYVWWSSEVGHVQSAFVHSVNEKAVVLRVHLTAVDSLLQVFNVSTLSHIITNNIRLFWFLYAPQIDLGLIRRKHVLLIARGRETIDRWNMFVWEHFLILSCKIRLNHF